MKDIASSAYVVRAITLQNLFPQSKQRKDFEHLIAENKCKDVEKFLKINLPKRFPLPESVFIFGDEDTSDDLQVGEMYVEFAESDLFVQKPTLLNSNLVAEGVLPKFVRWCTFG